MVFFYIISSFCYGIISGSFISMASARLIKDKNFIGRSKCVKCGHVLGWKDLIPLLSYIFLKAKCRYCSDSISIRYPLIEAITGVLFICTTLVYGIKNLENIILVDALCIAIMIMIVTDFEEYIIHDQIQFAIAIIGIIFAIINNYDWLQVMIMPFIMLTIALLLKYGFEFFTKKNGLGMGDVKLFFVSGILLSPELLSPYLLIAGILGVIMGIIWRIIGNGPVFPFGPSLGISLLGCILFPKTLSLLNF